MCKIAISKPSYINPTYKRDNAVIRGLVTRLTEYLQEHGTATMGQVVGHLHAPRGAVWIAAQQLQKEGIITVTQKEKNCGKTYYLFTIAKDSPGGRRP